MKTFLFADRQRIERRPPPRRACRVHSAQTGLHAEAAALVSERVGQEGDPIPEDDKPGNGRDEGLAGSAGATVVG